MLCVVNEFVFPFPIFLFQRLIRSFRFEAVVYFHSSGMIALNYIDIGR